VHRVWLTVAIAAAQFSTGLARAAPKADNEAQLAKAWAELHPGEEAPPPCEHKDPVRSVTGKVDQAPGKEHVVASRRYGVVLLSAAGHPLAWAAIGCGDIRYADERQYPAVEEIRLLRASGLAPNDILLRTSDLGHCGAGGEYVLLRREGKQLLPLAQIPAFLDVMCGGNPGEKWNVRIEVPSIGVLRATTDGSFRKGNFDSPSPWEPIHRIAIYRLVGNKFEDSETRNAPQH